MSICIYKFPFTIDLHSEQEQQGNVALANDPFRMFEVMLPSGTQIVMANIDQDGNFCVWISGNFDSNKLYWNRHYFGAYFTGVKIPNTGLHCGSTVDDSSGIVYHCYDITEWMNHAR